MTDDFEPVPDTQAPPDDEAIPDTAQAGEGVEQAPDPVPEDVAPGD